MKHTVVCVGKIKEKYWNDAIAEYAKRLGRYASFQIVEVADEKTPDGASAHEEELIRNKEGERILEKINSFGDCRVIALAIDGKRWDSVGFSKHIDRMMVEGNSHIVWVIGGSLGLSKAVMSRADEKISFSDMTFPHQMMRVILLEQIYRAYRIMRGEPYHK